MRGTRRPSSTFIRAWREHHGLTLEELGKRTGFDHSYLSRIETGTKRYNQTVLEALAREFGVVPGVLLMFTPSEYEEIQTARRIIKALRNDP
jgi:transcriptional regulator with XRE-family HTH domain